MALDEEYRKQCVIELDRKRKTIVGDVEPEDGNLLESVQQTIKETSEAIAHLVKLAPNGLKDDSDQELLRGRQELQEAIASMQNGLAQLEHELSERKIEIVK